MTIYPAPSVTGPSTLSVGLQGGAYPATTFIASGGDGTYSWSLASGSSLPAGLSLSTGGVLGGTPSVNGSFSFTVQVTSGPATSPATATRGYTLTILAPVVITNTSPLPNATVGIPYSPTLAATGGTGSYTWAGSGLPSWLGLSGATLSGTPSTAGTSSFSISATSVGGPGSVSKTFGLTVGYPSAVTLSFQSQPSGTQCYAVNQVISPPIKVKVTTTSGTPLAGVPVSVIAVLNNGSTVVVSQPNATTAADGVATFSNLSINKAGAYQLRVGTSSPWPATSVLSGKFKISPKC